MYVLYYVYSTRHGGMRRHYKMVTSTSSNDNVDTSLQSKLTSETGDIIPVFPQESLPIP